MKIEWPLNIPLFCFNNFYFKIELLRSLKKKSSDSNLFCRSLLLLMQSLLPENYRESESEGTEEMQNYAGQLPGVLTGQELHQLPLQEMSGHRDDAGADPG